MRNLLSESDTQPDGMPSHSNQLAPNTPSRYILARFIAWLMSCLLLITATAQAENDFTVRHGDRESPRIAITIDDCYDIRQVQAAVALCQQYDVRMTFFVIGSALKYADTDAWQAVLDAGCEIGNHSWSHTDLTRLSAHKIKFQMLRTQQKVDEILGYHYPMQVLRPPQGKTSNTVSKAVADIGYRAVARWDVSQTNASKAITDTQNGSILLYHARAKDIRCLTTLIPALLEQGYECVTVSELLDLPPITTAEYIYTYQQADAN